MITDKMYETCKDCQYYYGEINQCMFGEDDVPDDLEKKCEVNLANKNNVQVFDTYEYGKENPDFVEKVRLLAEKCNKGN